MNGLGFAEALLDALIARGFPRESLLLQPAFREGERWLSPDIVVLDPKTQDVLAVFETKKLLTDLGEAAGKSILEIYASSQALPPSTPLYLATTEGDRPGAIQLFRLKGGRLERVPELPGFQALRALRRSKSRGAVDREEKTTTKKFTMVSWRIATLGLLLFAADALIERLDGWKLLTTERLIVLGVVSALFVIPFVAKLRFLGLEYQGLRTDGDEDA